MRQRTRSPLILTYHAIGDVPLSRDWYRLFVAPAALQWQIRRLRGWGYRLVTFGELARAVQAGNADGLAALTFDDGFADNVVHLPTLMRELAVPATVFVISGWLGETHPDAPWTRIATEEEVRALHEAGAEIGAHTVTHADLTRLDYAGALDELAGSKRRLAEVIDAPVDVTAYPFGATNETVIAACAAAGFAAACGTRGRGSWDQPLHLPRQDIGNRQTRLAFYLKRDDRYERAVRWLEPLVSSGPGRFGIRVIRHLRSTGRA